MLHKLLEKSEQTELLKELLSDSQTQINHFFKNIDISTFSRVLELCLSCKGLIVFTGVGKSGIIAEKIAMTLSSTGTKAIYLPCMNFLHGDLGVLSPEDLVFLLSKSGESEELLNLLPFLERRQISTVAITSNEESRLARFSDVSMFLPMEKELCCFDLVPTVSSELQLIFGDILGIGLMRIKEFKLNDYAQNHPSGAIGKKITLLVKDIMIHDEKTPFCRQQDLLSEVLVELTQKRCGALIVVNDQKQLEGIFTDGDLRRALQRYGPTVLQQTIGDLMTQNAISVHVDTLAWDAMKFMQKDPNKWVMIVPVLGTNNRVVGLLRMHDIIHAGLG